MSKSKILLICGTINQTQMMHKIGGALGDCDCYYSPYYTDWFLTTLGKTGLLDFTVAFGELRKKTETYLKDSYLAIDDGGGGNDYDLVVTCTDIAVQQNIKDKKVVLVQEGLTEREGFLYHLVKTFNLPRYIANTAAFGLSDEYDVFCVASKGYRDLFAKKGVRPEKMIVTGIPNFDNAEAFRASDFPHEGFVLVATSNARETFKRENRKKYLKKAIEIAAGRPIIFKLHPAERHDRAIREIRKLAPHAPIYTDGNIHEMIAKCDVLVAQYSTVTFTATALGKEVHSWIDKEELQRLVPIQNGGTSARNIAGICRDLLERRNPFAGRTSSQEIRSGLCWATPE
jgi:hypothetical protein